MARIRLFILLAVCSLMASAALADDLGYVDCSIHPDATQVYSKARQTPDTLGAIPCGERFTILVYGFVFSRIQTRDGKVGYVYSNLITADHGTPAPAAQPVAARMPAQAAQPTASMPGERQPVTTHLTKMQPGPAQETITPAPAPAPAPAPTPAATVQVQAAVAPAPQPAPTQPAPAPVTPAPAPTPAPAAQPTTPPASQPAPPPPSDTQAAPSLPSAAQVQAATSASATSPVSSAPDPAAAPAPEAPPAAASQPSQPQPEAAEAAPAPVREATVRSTWERPLPGAHQSFLVELFGGYSFARFTSAGSSTNLNGGMGSFGYNLKPWLQIGGDSSYNFVTVSGTKYVLYGNHFGGRFFYHRGNRWGFTPFAEALVGGSRLDTTLSGVKTSENCISYKVGGGVDVRVKRHWEIRLINFDYYRTTFGAGGYSAAQNNYWASAGVVLRLFGSGASE